MKKIIFIVMIAAMICACSSNSASAAQMRNVKIVFGSMAITGSMSYEYDQKFLEEVERLSNGAIKIDYFPDSVLGSELASQQAIQTGALDMTSLGSSIANVVTKMGIFDLPYLVSNRDEVRRLVSSGVLDDLLKDAERDGIVIISFNETGFRHITNNTRPIVKPEDLEGLKIRTPNNAIRLEMFRALKANPTPINFGDLFSAVQQNVVDGQESSIVLISSSRIYEIQKYLSLTAHLYTPSPYVISLKTWNTLDPDHKKVILEAAATAAEYSLQLGEKYDLEFVEEFKKYGMEVNESDTAAFREVMMPLWDQFSEEIGVEFVEKVKKELGF